MADEPIVIAPQAPSTTEATNARMLNDVLGKLMTTLAAGNAAVVTLLTAIAAALVATLAAIEAEIAAVLGIAQSAALVWVIDGGGATITTGLKYGIKVPFACTITAWTIGIDQSGSIVIDIWKSSQAGYPPVIGGVITASAKPTVTTAQTATSTTLTGWTTSVAAGDWLFFNVNSVTSATWANITLTVTKV